MGHPVLAWPETCLYKLSIAQREIRVDISLGFIATGDDADGNTAAAVLEWHSRVDTRTGVLLAYINLSVSDNTSSSAI